MQRPSVMDSVALDLFLMRRLAIFLRQFPQVWLPIDSFACKQTPVELSLPGPAAAACLLKWYTALHCVLALILPCCLRCVAYLLHCTLLLQMANV